MNRISLSLVPLLLATTWVSAPLRADPTLTLLPSGDIFGPPGATIGWGFTITNDTDYIEITSAQFCVNPVNFPVSCNPPTAGTFTDYISQFNDIIVGPPDGAVTDSATQQFDSTALTGVGAFQIGTSAAIGATDSGQIVLTYNVYDADPLLGPFNTLLSDQILAADATVTVTAAGFVPEPSTAALAGMALALMAVAIGKRRRSLDPRRLGESPPGER